MRRTSKVVKTDFLTEQDQDDFVGYFEKDKKKADRRNSKHAAKKRREYIRERRYEEEWD